MREMTDGYPFVFVMKDVDSGNELLEYTLQYRFKSEKSHHTYIVRVEKYVKHLYCLKFFDKANINSKNKFSIRSNTFEPRTIFYTLYHIFLDVLRKDPEASLFFIGAEDERDELGESTRRYRVYRRFVSSVISDRHFEHYRVNELSLYVLINKKTPDDHACLVDEIAEKVREAYQQSTAETSR